MSKKKRSNGFELNLKKTGQIIKEKTLEAKNKVATTVPVLSGKIKVKSLRRIMHASSIYKKGEVIDVEKNIFQKGVDSGWWIKA